MMMGVNVTRGTHRLLEDGAGFDTHLVHRLGARPVAVVIQACGVVGKVLLERAAEIDVQQLHAMADREDRHVTLECLGHKGKFERVAPVADVVGAWVSFETVPSGVDVAPSWDQQPAATFEARCVGGFEAEYHLGIEVVLVTRQGCERSDDPGTSTTELDRVDVGEREPRVALALLRHHGDGTV